MPARGLFAFPFAADGLDAGTSKSRGIARSYSLTVDGSGQVRQIKKNSRADFFARHMLIIPCFLSFSSNALSLVRASLVVANALFPAPCKFFRGSSKGLASSSSHR